MDMVHHRDVIVELSTPSTGRSARDLVSLHTAVKLGCHHLRVVEDGRGSGQ
jgi:hypothetical protein